MMMKEDYTASSYPTPTIHCDETCDPLLDQGLVEVSGSFVLLTFAVEKIRADSSSF